MASAAIARWGTGIGNEKLGPLALICNSGVKTTSGLGGFGREKIPSIWDRCKFQGLPSLFFFKWAGMSRIASSTFL